MKDELFKKHLIMDIVKELFPEEGELKIKDGFAVATIVDEELDPIECKFYADDCVVLDTSKLTYVTLSIENLYDLIDLINQAEDYYNQDKTIES